jgi:hypothetical protein
MRFSWQTKAVEGSNFEIALQGQINEGSHLDNLEVEMASRPLAKTYLNLEGVENINSSGVAKWIKLISNFEALNLQVEFTHCPIEIVQQMNMVPQFRGKYHVSSAYAPYFCAKCDKEHEVEIQIPKGATSKMIQVKDSMPCKVCDSTMIFDDVPDDYLSFLDS